MLIVFICDRIPAVNFGRSVASVTLVCLPADAKSSYSLRSETETNDLFEFGVRALEQLDASNGLSASAKSGTRRVRKRKKHHLDESVKKSARQIGYAELQKLRV